MMQQTVRPVATRRQSMGAAGIAAGAWWLAACGAPETPVLTSSTAPVTITYGNDWSNANKKPIMTAGFERFAKLHPSITVQWTDLKAGSGNLNAKLAAMFAAGTPDDVLLLSDSALPYYRDLGAFIDLAPYLKASKIDLKNYTYVDASTIVGSKVFFLPFSVGTNVWYYNKTMFQRFGVPLPNDNWTWNDAADAAKRMSKSNEGAGAGESDTQRQGTSPDATYGIGPGPAATTISAELLPLIMSNGGHHISADFKQTQLTQPASLEAIVWLADRITRDRSWVPPEKRDAFAFNNGNVAMEVNGIGDIGSATGAGRIQTLAGKFDWDIMLQPRSPKTGKRVQTYQHQPNGVVAKPNGNTARVEAGFRLAEFLAGEEMQQIVAKDRGNVPAVRKMVTASPYADSPPASMSLVGKALETPGDVRFFNGYDEWREAYTTALFEIWSGRVAASSGAQIANAAGDAVLAKLTRK